MRKDGFTVCAKHYIKCLRQEGRYATAHVYESALRSFTMFCGTAGVSFRQITRGNLKRYSSYLMDCHLRLNTISTYMRMLRCIYNRGVDMHQTPRYSTKTRNLISCVGHKPLPTYCFYFAECLLLILPIWKSQIWKGIC